MNLIERLERMANFTDSEEIEAIETVRAMQEALQEILRVHANDNNRPEAFYIAARVFSRAEGNAG